GNPCTADACDPVTGVTHLPVDDGTTCADADACNGDEICVAGNCMPGLPPAVDDGNPCTADACDPVTGVTHLPVADGTACADTDVCNGAETCVDGSCVPGAPLVVDDGNPCTADACDPVTGIANVPVADGTACADADVCNGAETCAGGSCVPGTPLVVDDGNPCTADTCDPVAGVANPPVPNGTDCTDADACNGVETCQEGACTAGTPPVIDDSNPCTTDSCDPASGPVHVALPNGTSCSDGDMCNGVETCLAGACTAGDPLEIEDDGNPCTTDGCDPGTGATLHVPAPVGTTCPDEDICNGTETCDSEAVCVPGATLDVDDGDPSTIDTCDPVVGPVHRAAPLLDPTIPTTVFAAGEWLYTGDDPIQTGVLAGTIELHLAAIVHGRVLNASGNPLPNVAVRVRDRDEFGTTITHADGRFEMAVNGGERLTFSFTREGYLETQRALDLPVNDEPVLEDLVLLERAQTVTLVDLASTEPVQIVRGGEVADADGAREAILLVPSGTTATLRHADGTTEDLATLHLRLTESTVGEWGPAAVPAELPATTAYAYVLEIDADEAVATGATEVILSQPLPLYVDNFLDFPVGTTIPTGMYDRERGAWMPDASGFVVAIVDVTNGVAELDTDGDGAAEPASELEAMGITLDERTALASLFANDLELWRVAPARLAGPTALNWARDLPTSPDPIPVAANSDEGYPIECGEPGASMIECQNRVHTESVPIAGTPLSLTYRSDRVGDATALTHLDIPLTGNTVSPGVEEIQVAVRVAGRAFRYEVTPAPNLTLPFQWDGLDEHGRLRQGTLPVTVTVTHLYAASYFSVNAFGKYSSNGTETGVESRTPAVVQRRYVRHFTRWDAPEHGLGGWSLDAHHIYSPAVGRLYPGDGPARSSRAIGGVAELFAGGGTSTAEGAPALETRISSQAATLAVGPDGSVYFTDNRTTSIPTNTIRRVDPNGLVFRVAGNTTAGYSGDGGLATEAQLSNVTDVAVAPDGSVYIADTDNNRVRRVDPNGIITTFAGTGVLAESNSSLPDAGVPATSAPLRQPRAVAVGPDGSVFIGHSRWTRYSVLRVDPSGVAYTVVGGGPNHACLLDVPGPQATTQPYDLMVGPDGTLYIADQECAQNILKVGVDGVLHAVPGIGSPWLAVDVSTAIHPFGVAVDANGTVYAGARGNNSHVWALFPNSEVPRLLVGASTGSPFVSGGPATGMIVVSDVESAGSPVALAPDGSLYTADNSRIYRIHRGTPDLRHGESIIPSLDGSEAYRFDPQGRHLETVDTHTGATRLAFEYDPLHFVSSVTDADGNVTAIERDSAGVPLRIIAPHGQVTTLSVNPLGQLETIAGPEGQIWQLSYDPGALLATVTDPRSYPSHLTYNSLGQLVRHEDSAGGYQELATPDPLVPTTVSRTTASGIVTTFRTEHRADGGYELRSALPDGTEATVVATPDGVTVATLADGTITTRKETPDPVWGMLAPQGTTTTALPSGLTRTLITSRTATTDPSDPTVLLTERVVSATGGYVAQVDYDGTTRTFTTTDPVNRTATRVIDPLGHTIATAMPGINGTTFLHDTEGRLSTVTQGSRLTQRDYFVTADGANGYLATLTNAASVTTTYTPDALGRVLVESVAGIATGFAWDARNNLVGLTPPSRPSHIQTFTPVNLLDTYTPPAAGVPDPATDYEYDLDRHLVLTTKPGGVVVDRDYDFAGRLDLLTMPTGTIDYAYYPVDCTGSCAPGRLAAIAGPSSIALSLGYDGSLPTGITWTGEVNGSVAWSYDNAFRRTVESVSNGATTASVAFSYANDGLVRCASLSTCSGSEADALHLVYSALTPRLASTRLGLVTDELTYNPYGELATYTARFDTADLYRVVYDSATTPRDGLGRVVEKTETLQGAERSSRYGYDDVGRLIAVTEDGLLTEEYQYDDNGNRRFLMTTEGTTEGTYDEQDRMVAYGDFVYTYTPDGALASKTDTATNDVTTYQYDALGSLLRVDLPDSTVIEYVVDGRGRRMAKRVDGVTVRRWLYRDHLSPVAELDGDGQLTWQYVYGPKSGVPAFAVRVEDGALYRVVSDQLGSVVLVVNAANAADVLLSARYSAFGEQSVVLGDPEALPFGFAGGRYDPDTGLVRFGARDYDPTTGRWTSREPKLRSDSPNQYLYGRGNPVDLRDPTGHEPREVAHAAIPEAPPSGQTLTDL
ncbi:MAG: hypothetical protein JW751_21060, partial [Polyangiaceae bacterium]|nr:hypothetical protein [Polyangiaceae bacterium]